MSAKPFWQTKTLMEMTQQEWESLCDGCGKCCLVKLEDDEAREIFYTNVACKLLDSKTCRCKDYPNRLKKVPGCLKLTPDRLDKLEWLPGTCSYKLLYQGKELPGWHHLVCGNRQRVHQAGVSVSGKVISEEYVHPDQIEEHIVQWVEQGEASVSPNVQ